MKAVLAGVLATLGLGCHTVATQVSSSPTPNVRVGTHTRTWELRRADEPLGLVVLFQEDGRAGDSLYVVRNLWHQDLGLIDGLGRAFRFLPHLEEPAWVGTGTVLAGARRILDVEDPCTLVEIDETQLLPRSASSTSSTLDPASSGPAHPVQAPPPSPLSDVGLPQSR